MNFKFLFLSITLLLFSTGCSILNPYNSEFLCPGGDYGTCTSVGNAYDKSKNNFFTHAETGIDVQSVQRNLTAASIVHDEEKPIVTPPEIARVLILPYAVGDNMMYGHRFTYVITRHTRFDVLATSKIQGFSE